MRRCEGNDSKVNVNYKGKIGLWRDVKWKTHKKWRLARSIESLKKKKKKIWNFICRWPKSTWKDVQCCYLLEKWKWKLQRGITLIQVRTAIIKKCINYIWWGCREKGILLHCWWECKLVQTLWRTVWKLFKKLKVHRGGRRGEDKLREYHWHIYTTMSKIDS